MKHVRTAPVPSGLTLIELVLAMTILSLAGVLVSGAFGTGWRAWQSGLSHGREELVARILAERLSAQLRSAVEAPAEREDKPAVAFAVDDGSLRFVTIAGPGAAPAQVSYSLEGQGGEPHLVYREYPWPDKEFFGESKPRREEDVPEVIGFSVSVRKSADDTAEDSAFSGDGNVVPEEWDPADRRLPASVTVEFDVATDDGGEPQRYSIVVPLLMGTKQ